MARYLVCATYSAGDFQGVVKDEPPGFKAAVEKAIASVSARLEAAYYSVGDRDGVLIVGAPDTPAWWPLGCPHLPRAWLEPTPLRC